MVRYVYEKGEKLKKIPERVDVSVCTLMAKSLGTRSTCEIDEPFMQKPDDVKERMLCLFYAEPLLSYTLYHF